MNSYRPTLYGTRHAVSAGHYLAATAGFEVGATLAPATVPPAARNAAVASRSKAWPRA